MKEIELPNLARMAKDYLPISGSSVPIERRFSNGADLITPNRSQLAPETIQTCLELKDYFAFGGDDLFNTVMSQMFAASPDE